MDVVIISPEPGMHKEIGQYLLSLAEHPRDVQWVTYPEAGFQVPLELFGKFEAGDGTNGEYVKWVPKEEEPAQEAPKRRRRPRKEETSTDNNIPEEE